MGEMDDPLQKVAEQLYEQMDRDLTDLNGETWTYTNPEPLVFVRHRVTVEYISGDLAVLLDGPPAGTSVVTVGAAELFGAELGVGR